MSTVFTVYAVRVLGLTPFKRASPSGRCKPGRCSPLVTGVGAAIRSIHYDLEQERMDSHPDSRPRQRAARPVPALERHP